MSTNQVPKELQDDFEIVGSWPAKFQVSGLEVSGIEWSKMTREFAEHLIAEGWKGIKRKDAPKSNKPTVVGK